jgi:hypothetical protein
VNSNLASALILLTGGLVGFVGFTRPIPPAPEVPVAPEVIPAGCWQSGDVPLAPLPRSAYVRYLDGREVYTDRRVVVDRAFREVLTAYDAPRFDTIALCRRGVR